MSKKSTFQRGAAVLPISPNVLRKKIAYCGLEKNLYSFEFFINYFLSTFCNEQGLLNSFSFFRNNISLSNLEERRRKEGVGKGIAVTSNLFFGLHLSFKIYYTLL